MTELELSIALTSRLIGMAKVIGDKEAVEHMKKNLAELLLLKSPKGFTESTDK